MGFGKGKVSRRFKGNLPVKALNARAHCFSPPTNESALAAANWELYYATTCVIQEGKRRRKHWSHGEHLTSLLIASWKERSKEVMSDLIASDDSRGGVGPLGVLIINIFSL